MATSGTNAAVRTSQAELDATMNRIQLKMAGIESMVKSWTAQSKCNDVEEHRKTDAEIDAEDALYFRPQPPYLGVGCPIPDNYMVSEAERSKKTLEAKFGRGLQASKRRNAEEKAESAKRAMRDDSSDDEGGRSSLGKQKKKLKTVAAPEPIQPDTTHIPALEVGEKDAESKYVAAPDSLVQITPSVVPTSDVSVKKKKKSKPESMSSVELDKIEQPAPLNKHHDQDSQLAVSSKNLAQKIEESAADKGQKSDITKNQNPLPIRSKKLSQKKRAKLRKMLALARTS